MSVKKRKKEIYFRFGLKPQPGYIFATYALVPEGDESLVMMDDFYSYKGPNGIWREHDEYMRLVVVSTEFQLIEIDKVCARDWQEAFYSGQGIYGGSETVTVDLGNGVTEEARITVLRTGTYQLKYQRTSREWRQIELGGLSNYVYIDKDKNLIYRYVDGTRKLTISGGEYEQNSNGFWVRVGNVYNLISSTRLKAIEKVFKKSTKYQQEPEERDLEADITAVASYEINFARGWTSHSTYDPQSTIGGMLLSPMGTVVSMITTSSKNYEERDIWNDTYKSQNGTSVWAGVPRRILPEVGNLNIHSEYFKGWRDAVRNTILKANDKDDYLISFPYAENISSILLINKVEYLLPEERYEINGQVYTVKDYTNYFSAPFMLSSAFRKGIDGPYAVVTLDAGLPSQREASGLVSRIRDGNKLYVWDDYKQYWLDVLIDQHPHRYTEPEVVYIQEVLSGYFFNGSDSDEPKGYMISSWFGNYIYKIRIDELIPDADFAEALMYGVNHPINVGTDLLTKRTTAKQTLESQFGVKGGAFMFDVLERIKDDMSVNENGDTKLEVLGKLMMDIQGLPAYLKIYDPKTTTLWVEKYEIVNNGNGKRILFKERFPVPFLVPLKNRKKAIRDWDIDTIHDMESLLRSVCYVPYD